MKVKKIYNDTGQTIDDIISEYIVTYYEIDNE